MLEGSFSCEANLQDAACHGELTAVHLKESRCACLAAYDDGGTLGVVNAAGVDVCGAVAAALGADPVKVGGVVDKLAATLHGHRAGADIAEIKIAYGSPGIANECAVVTNDERALAACVSCEEDVSSGAVEALECGAIFHCSPR